MKTSIRKRIAVTFIALMAAVLAAIGVFHWFFVGYYYYADKQKTIIRSWELIQDDSLTNTQEQLEHYCSVNGLTYCLTDPGMTSLYTNAQDGSEMAGKLLGIVLGMEDENTTILRESHDYRLIRIHDRFSRMEYLELWGTLPNGNYYLVACPVESIAEAAKISTRFYIIVGIVAVLVGALIITLTTRRITEPVQELTALSQRMAQLDFDARYESGGADEIGILGENFNTMSEKLESAIGELKTANARLEKDIEEKTQIDEMRREFLASVSHELKTPIALIQGYAEGLRDNVNDDPESREFYCDVIMDESEKMNRMVRQLLTLNQLESGDDRLQFERFDLYALIRGVLQAAALLIGQSEAKIVFEAEGKLPVWGDEFKIEEVVTNYLTNALHHLEGERIVRISCRREDGKVVTEVYNSGKPIPEDELEKIWLKFYKVDKARTRAYGGSGIGLSIVKAVMDAHGQTCGVRNAADGVIFYFTLDGASAEGDGGQACHS